MYPPVQKVKVDQVAAGAVSACVAIEGGLSFQTLSTTNAADGLSNDMVQSTWQRMRKEIYGWLRSMEWSKFVTESSTFENYFFSAYSQGNVYGEFELCVSQREHTFGSNHGFVIIDPNLVKRSNASFPPVFTNLSVNGINMMPSDKDFPLTAACLILRR